MPLGTSSSTVASATAPSSFIHFQVPATLSLFTSLTSEQKRSSSSDLSSIHLFRVGESALGLSCLGFRTTILLQPPFLDPPEISHSRDLCQHVRTDTFSQFSSPPPPLLLTLFITLCSIPPTSSNSRGGLQSYKKCDNCGQTTIMKLLKQK